MTVEQLRDRSLDHRRPSRKLRASAGPSGVSTDSGWNWTPTIGNVRVAHRHHLAVVCVCRRLEHVRQARRRERVVAAGVERLRQAGEQAGAVVLHRARLAVQELARVADFAAEDLDDRLVAEADAERRRRRAEPADDLLRCAGAGRPSGTGGDDELVGREPLRLVCVDLVVAEHLHVHAERAEQMREVVRERVVVVDQEHHRSANSIAASRAASLLRHSWCSSSGIESATMPPPACR